MRAVLIANPTAHQVTDARRRVVERALEATFDLDIVSTRSRGHASELATEAAFGGAKTVIAYGGDGTVHEVINGLRRVPGGSEVHVGVLPGGGTNVLARNLGYPVDLVEATGHLLERVEGRETRSLRLGRLVAETDDGLLDRFFVFGTGVGLDAATVRRVDESGLRERWGDLAYVWCGLRAFFDLKGAARPGLVIEADEGPIDAWWAIVCNTDPFTYFGSRPIRVAPEAHPDAGLDVVAGRSATFLRTLRWLRQSLGKGKHTAHPEVLYLRDRSRITVRTRRPIDLQADGEHLGRTRRLEVTTTDERVLLWA